MGSRPLVDQSAHHVLRNADYDDVVTVAVDLRRRDEAIVRDDVGPLFWRHPYANDLADRIGGWPQRARRGGADDRDLGFGARLVRLERAPPIDRYLHGREIVR